MHKKLLFSLTLLLLVWFEAKAQTTPPCSNPPPQGASSCGQTCVYCDFDGYMGTSGGTPSTNNLICGQIVIHNDQWLGFVAVSQSMSIEVTSSNCVLGEGIQIAFFNACNAPDALVCNPGIVNGEGIPLDLTYNNFTPGQTYYLMIDGSFGDVCDFNVDITSGTVTPPAPDIASQPVGPTQLCPGATAVYTIPPVDNAGWYRWTAPAGSRINGVLTTSLQVPAPQGTTVTITFGNTPLNGSVCVGAGNACFPATQICLPVSLTLIPPTILPPITLCYEDRIFTWTEAPYQTVNFSVGPHTLSSTYDNVLGCDSIVKQTITVLPQNIKPLGNKYICQGDCFILNAQSYCSPGLQQQLVVSGNACDTLYTFTIIVIPSIANIPAVGQIDCSMPNLTLTSTGSTTGPTAMYRWTNVGWNTIGSISTQNVSGVGTYNLIVTNTVGGKTCRDTATVMVTSSAAFPGANATGGTITCTNPSVTLQASSPSPGVNYHWAGPGITAANQFVQNPMVTVAGNYTISVTNPSNGCTSTALAVVIPNDTLPNATAVGGTISCTQPNVTLDGGSNIANASYSWSGPGINAGNQNQENPQVTAPGSYVLTVVNPANGCSRTAPATVNQDNTAPIANAGIDQSITCQQSSVVLNGSATGTGTLQYTWTGPDINAGNQNQQTPQVSLGGSYILNVLNTGNGCSDKDTVVITSLLTLPTASAGADGILNCTVLNATLNGGGSSQGANFTALWTGPGINAGNQSQYSPVVTVPGIYTLSITNTTSNCTATDQVEIVLDNTVPTVNAGMDQILTCSSPNGVTLSGSGAPANVSFLWTGPGISAGNATITNPSITIPGTYTLVATNPVNHCTASDQVIISQDANEPVASTGSDQVLNCTVNSITINTAGTSSGAGIQYSWTGPGIAMATQNQLNQTVTVAGTYILTVNNTTNGCAASDTLLITQQVTLPVASAGADDTLNCVILSVTLDATASTQGANFSGIWSGPGINAGNQNQLTPQVNLPGVYTLTVTDISNTCTSTDAVTIFLDNTLPTVDAGMDEVLTCTTSTGIALNGSGSPANIAYLWTGPGITAGNATMANPTINDPGTYSLTVTNTTNQCTASDQVIITEDSSVPTANAGSDLTLNCAVNSVSIDASASTVGVEITYQWTGPGISGANATTQNPQGITLPGTYSLTVTNTTNSCSNTDVVMIAIDTISPASVTNSNLILNCYNNNTDTLDATGSSTGAGFTLLWSGPGITPATQALIRPAVHQAGTYTVLITNTLNNCSASADAMVVADTLSPVADAGLDDIIDCANSSVPIGGNSSTGANIQYLWTGPDIDLNNQALATLNVSLAGTYSLAVTNMTNGCTASNDVVVDEDLVFPIANAGVDSVINCTHPNILLDGSASSSGGNIQLLWSGLSITPANQAAVAPDVSQADNYVLTVTNTTNSCVSKDTVTVLEDMVAPVAMAGTDAMLDCQTTNTILDGSGSSAGSSIQYLWAGQGITAANATQQSPSIDSPDTYTLVVTNTTNGCSSQDDVVVGQDITLPIANAGTDLLLDCMQPTQAIDGSGSSSGAGMEYLWQGADINSSNFNLISPMVSDSGIYIVIVTNIQNHCTATDMVYVGMDADLPVTSAGADQVLTCAIDTLQLDGALSQSGLGILYAWSGPGVVAGESGMISPNIFEPGNYTLTVTNTTNGCSNTDLVMVTEDIVPPFVLAGDDQIITCANSTNGVMLSSNGSSSGPEYTITWSGSGITSANANDPEPVVTAAGSYILSITNTVNGCSDTDEVMVQLDQDAPVSMAGADQTITCAITEVLLDGSASTSPSGQLEYTWSGPGITTLNEHDAVVSVSVSGDYSLTIVNPVSGCQSIDNVLIDLDTQAPVATATGDTITCQVPTGTLSANSSDAGSLFSWSGPGITAGNANQSTLQVNQPGAYSVTVTAANGCTDVALATMDVDENFPVGTAEGDELNCLNNGVGSLTGTTTTPGVSFFWTGPGGFNSNNATTPVTVAGMYTFNIVAANGCVNPIPVTVSSNFTTPTIVATVPGNLNCTTTSLSINGSGTSTGGTLSYAWTTADGNLVSGINTLTPVVDAPGAYTLLVTNQQNGCTASKTVQVINDPNIPTALDITIRDILCFGDKNGVIAVSGVTGGIEPFVFSLNGGTGSTVNQFSGLAADEYLITMEDANGCLLDTLVSISEPAQLLADLGPDLFVHLGDSVAIHADIMNETPISSVKWNYSPNKDSSSCCDFSYQPLQSYRHEITVLDENGCAASDVVTVTVRKERQVFIPNIIDLNSDNPLNAQLMIHGGSDVVKVHSWLIFDRWGDAIFEVRDFLPNDPSYAWKGTIRGEKGQPAVYVWMAQIEFIDGLTELFEGDVTIMR